MLGSLISEIKWTLVKADRKLINIARQGALIHNYLVSGFYSNFHKTLHKLLNFICKIQDFGSSDFELGIQWNL